MQMGLDDMYVPQGTFPAPVSVAAQRSDLGIGRWMAGCKLRKRRILSNWVFREEANE